jgi:hypothetical protein
MTDFAVATLILRAGEITDVETSVGVTNPSRSMLTFKNINLRTLLGDMYEQYDTFNLSLTSITSAKTLAALGVGFGDNDVDNLNLTLYVSGLPFINNSYSFTRAGNTDTAFLGFYQYPSTNATTGFRVYNQAGTLTIGKSQDVCNLTLTFKRVVDNADPVTLTRFPNTNFTFLINGISKKSKTNGSLIF